MLEFNIFKHPMFALSATISIVLNMAMFSGMILIPMYTQTVRGISPFDSGLLMLPGALLMALMSPVTGKLFDKFGARILASIGLLITVVTTYLLSKLSMETTYTEIVILFFRSFLRDVNVHDADHDKWFERAASPHEPARYSHE